MLRRMKVDFMAIPHANNASYHKGQGFRKALSNQVGDCHLLLLSRQSTVKLITTSKYPSLRCTRVNIANLDFMYKMEFLTDLGELHVPSPLRIPDHAGQDTSRETQQKEVPILTKMNWNPA